MPKTVLLTGGGGSIGVHTYSHFMHNTDWHVFIVDSFRHKGWADRIKICFDNHPDWIPRTTVITHDLIAPFSDMTKKKLGKIDYIVNLASLSDVYASIQNPVETILNNTALVTHMLEYAREVKPEVFIQFSTDEVYGPTEIKNGKYVEWSPIVPSNPYAASKACQEAVAISYWRTYNVPVIITNTMNNFGEMQQSNKYPVIIQKAIANNEKITIHGEENDLGSRSYIHSRNCSDAVLFILKNYPPHMHIPGSVDKPDRYNIAGDKQLDNLELVKEIAKAMGKDFTYECIPSYTTRPGHDKHYGLNDTKIKNLGWKSPVSFEESLKNTVEWQQANPEWLG